MQLFYNPDFENSLTLEGEEHSHATKVLRKKIGDILFVMNGKGNLFKCKLDQITSKKSLLSIIEVTSFDTNTQLHIAIAPTKNNNRMEFFLEKATEIGIRSITPILCKRSERKIIKSDRMHKIIVSAAKQSKSFYVPVLNEMISLEKFLTNNVSDHKFIAHCEENNIKKELTDYTIGKTANCTILIGPEGDFTPIEIEQALNHGYNELSLGNNRLRTETAGIVACTLYNHILT